MPANRLRVTALLTLPLLLGIGPGLHFARAQAPTEAQRNAIRQSCPDDYRAHCASVPPGGSASLQCLNRNLNALSSACRAAVAALSPGGAASPPAPSGAGTGAPTGAGAGIPAGGGPMRACGGDLRRYCDGVPPGGGRLVLCLRENAASLSPGCRQALRH